MNAQYNKEEMKEAASRFFNNLGEYLEELPGRVYTGAVETWDDFKLAAAQGYENVVFEASEARKAAAEKAGYVVRVVKHKFHNGKMYMVATIKKHLPDDTE